MSRGEGMSTLLLRLAAPMQSWGVSSKFDRRMTALEPSRSGVIGLLAAAMGMQRTDSLEMFCSLKFGVRIDQPGTIERDFQMVHRKEGKKESSWLTERYYLEDAIFLAALEGDNDFLQDMKRAVQKPVYPLFLGRRACPPAGRLCLGIRDMGLRESLMQEEWQASRWYQKKAGWEQISSLEIVRDAEIDEEFYVIRDVPKSFSQLKRQYQFRNVIREHVSLDKITKGKTYAEKMETSTEHDPMTLWEE